LYTNNTPTTTPTQCPYSKSETASTQEYDASDAVTESEPNGEEVVENLEKMMLLKRKRNRRNNNKIITLTSNQADMIMLPLH
jgi:hypothetical protein